MRYLPSTLTAKEREHVAANGDAFERALAITSRVVLDCRAFVGLDLVRHYIATQAALVATGFRIKRFSLPRDAGRPDPSASEIAEQVFADALDAARKARQ